MPHPGLAAAAALGLALLLGGGAVRAAEQPFAQWLAGVETEARQQGIGAATLAAAFAGIEPIPRVIELDRRQPESTMTFEEYQSRIVSRERVERGREMLEAHRPLLEQVAARYGVQPRFIVAFWGIETSYGRITGRYPVIGSLATLAYDGRRSSFFRKELMNALKILDEGHIRADAMTGSWAGAMGQSQFMPSSFLSYAVDFDGDGRRDIWQSLPDVFASAANYLKRAGWRDDLTWGREVSLPPGFDESLIAAEVRKPLPEWAALGVRRANGGPLPDALAEGRLVRPARGPGGPAFIAYSNYDAILRWNRSNYFAVAVGRLSDAIGYGG